MSYALAEVIAAIDALLRSDAVLAQYTSQIYFGNAPTGAQGCYVVIPAVQETPDEDRGRKRLWYSVDVYDFSGDALRSLNAAKRIVELIERANLTLANGVHIRSWCDNGPQRLPDEPGVQHWTLDFVIQYGEQIGG